MKIPRCKTCNCKLDDDNWYPSRKKYKSYLCIECSKDFANTEKQKENQKRYREENKELIKLFILEEYNARNN